MRAESLHQIVLAAVIAGLGLSLYAGYETVNAAAANSCSFSVVFSCSKVLQSGKTTFLGVADWIVGALGFAALLAIDIPLYRYWSRRLLGALLGLASGGLVIAVYLASIEVTQIGALCPVCFASYVADGIVLAAGVALYRRSREGGEPRPAPPEPTTSNAAP
jgi:uncharacterized membrane protein